jgi:hypothetical protein
MSTQINIGHCGSATGERTPGARLGGCVGPVVATFLDAAAVIARMLGVFFCVIGTLTGTLVVAVSALVTETGSNDVLSGEVMMRSWYR